MNSVIYNGESAEIGEFPWQTHLNITFPSQCLDKVTGTYSQCQGLCGGTLIDSHTLLTAAHCVRKKVTRTAENRSGLESAVSVVVTLGQWDTRVRGLDELVYTVISEDIDVHSQYDQTTNTNDIAKIFLE